MNIDFGDSQLGNGRSNHIEEDLSALKEVADSLAKSTVVLLNIRDSCSQQNLKNMEVDFPKEGIELHKVKRQFECNLVRQALRHTNGNQVKAAKLLSVSPTTLNSIIKRNGILRSVEIPS